MLTPLAWDSAFFGLRLARLSLETLDASTATAVVGTAREQRLDGVSLLLAAADARGILAAQEVGFRLVDVRVSLERPAGAPAPSLPDLPLVRTHRHEDLPALEAIAERAHRDTRFWRDPRFPPARAADLYRTWIRKECEGDADRVLVAVQDGAPSGYVSCHARGTGAARIGLLGVREDARGRGTATALLAAGLHWLAQTGTPAVEVVTQGQSVAAQRLYQRAGFLPSRVELWFHLWLT